MRPSIRYISAGVGQRSMLLVPLALLASCSGPEPIVSPDISAALTEDELVLEGSAVVKRMHEVPEISRTLVQGHKVADGGCAFEATNRREAGGTPTVESVAEYNPETCVYLIATHSWEAFSGWYRRNVDSSGPGTLRSVPDNGSGGGSLSSFGGSQSSTKQIVYSGGSPDLPLPGITMPVAAKAKMPSSCSPYVGQLSTPFQEIYTIDPVHITTSRSYHALTYWYLYNDCVNYVLSYLVSEWFVFSGWELQSHVHPDPFPVNNWSAVLNHPFQTMRNTTFADTFCPWSPGNTYTYYKNWITAWKDGYSSYSWQGYSTGGCSGLLSTFRVYG